MQIAPRSIPMPAHSQYPAYPDVTPEQVNQARNAALIKKDEWQAQSEQQATARRTMMVSYVGHQQDKAVVERYMEASGAEHDDRSSPSAVDIYRAANRYQRQQNLTDYLRFQQSPLGQQIGNMVGAEQRKGVRLDIVA